MHNFRGTVDYGDDRLRTYLIQAGSIEDAQEKLRRTVEAHVSYDVTDDAEEHDNYDDTLSFD